MIHFRTTPESLLASYAELIDAGDFDGIGALFGDATITDGSGTAIARGSRQVAALYRATTRRYTDGTPATKHLTTNSQIDLSDDETIARVRSYFVVFQQVDQGPLQPIVAGRYRDTLVRTEDGWRFDQRQMLPEMFGDVSNHLLFDPSQHSD